MKEKLRFLGLDGGFVPVCHIEFPLHGMKILRICPRERKASCYNDNQDVSVRIHSVMHSQTVLELENARPEIFWVPFGSRNNRTCRSTQKQPEV
jgi:hypothetical protein